MTVRQKPYVGNWYMNPTGQLIKVWAVGYSEGHLAKVVVEFLNGKRRIVDICDWRRMDLEMHLYRSVGNRRNEELHR